MRRLLFVTLIALIGTVGCRGSQSATSFRIGMIPKGSTHEHWKRVHAGAQKAVREFAAAGVAVDVIWKAPIREDDREQQVEVVEGFISQGVNGLVLAPLDSRALVRPVEEAKAAGIPTVIFDSALATTGDQVSYVSTDNGKGGHLAGQRMGELLKGSGTVLMLRYQEGSAATEERERGFLDELTRFPNIHVVSSDQFAGPTRDTAKSASENLLNRFADKVDGIFTPNESSTAGMLLALQDIGKAGTITFVGFDYSSTFIAPLERGELKGFVVQNPVNMGYLSVKTMVNHLRGQAVPATLDTGVSLVTLDNLKDPAVQAVINPPDAAGNCWCRCWARRWCPRSSPCRRRGPADIARRSYSPTTTRSGRSWTTPCRCLTGRGSRGRSSSAARSSRRTWSAGAPSPSEGTSSGTTRCSTRARRAASTCPRSRTRRITAWRGC
jgi:ribose transport system substrate-binding protein